MGRKVFEKNCFEGLKSVEKVFGHAAKQIYNFIFEQTENVDFEHEKPDIRIIRDDCVIGLEHFLTDVIFGESEKQSLTRTEDSKINEAVNKYKDNKELLDQDMKNGKAPNIVFQLVSDRINREKNYDYKQFIENFRNVSNNHNNKCNIYRENLKKVAQENNVENILLGCLIEIPYPQTSEYVLCSGNKKWRQRMNGIPITKDMLLAIQNMKNFDFIIIYMYCYDSFRNKNKRTRVCYCFYPNRVALDIREQGLSEKIFSFNYPGPKYQISVDKESIKNDGENITVTLNGKLV